MRPQHITAENLIRAGVPPHEIVGFNEAAAYHCGKPTCGRGAAAATPRLQ